MKELQLVAKNGVRLGVNSREDYFRVIENWDAVERRQEAGKGYVTEEMKLSPEQLEFLFEKDPNERLVDDVCDSCREN